MSSRPLSAENSKMLFLLVKLRTNVKMSTSLQSFWDNYQLRKKKYSHAVDLKVSSEHPSPLRENLRKLVPSKLLVIAVYYPSLLLVTCRFDVIKCQSLDTSITSNSIFLLMLWERSETGLTASVLKKRSKTHKRLKECFLIRRNRTKRANFRGNLLFQATYNNTTENS